jgi:lipopolysaccharide/colanic/teichoic acid biosynthesis glycosyltransferase
MWKILEEKYSVKKGPYALFFKRVIDFLITFIGFVVISPIFLVLCILVRCKLGSPIFFRQKRTGKDEKTFEMIKFRTMTDARDADGNLLPDTKRFTKFGNFLRKSSLDELPELLNVLKGDMSLVGPRPLYPFYLPYYTEKESLRHSVRGGITGLAQVNGRALLRWNERFEKDVEYVREITFVGDIKILLITLFKAFRQDDIGIPSVTEEGGLHIVREVQRPDYVQNSIEPDANQPVFVMKK